MILFLSFLFCDALSLPVKQKNKKYWKHKKGEQKRDCIQFTVKNNSWFEWSYMFRVWT